MYICFDYLRGWIIVSVMDYIKKSSALNGLEADVNDPHNAYTEALLILAESDAMAESDATKSIKFKQE